MALETVCGTCGKVIKFPAALLGKSGKCLQCGELLRLTDPNAVPNVPVASEAQTATATAAEPTTKDKVYGCGFGLVLLLLVGSCSNYFWPDAEEPAATLVSAEPQPNIRTAQPKEPTVSFPQKQETSKEELIQFAEITDRFYARILEFAAEGRATPLESFAPKVHQLRCEMTDAKAISDNFHPIAAKLYVGSPMGNAMTLLERCWPDQSREFAKYDYFVKTVFNERDVFLSRPIQFPDYPKVGTAPPD